MWGVRKLCLKHKGPITQPRECKKHCTGIFFGSGYSKSHPKSSVGLPGPQQGLNVGLVLLRLDRIRDSHAYRILISDDGVK